MSGKRTGQREPKVTVGLPVYNGEKYIESAIRSLLAQSFVDFEIIVSDNASTDNTRQIVEQLWSLDKRIRYFCQPENVGAIQNFNDVVQKSRGDYFMWAAADDLWDAAWIERLLENMHESCAISFGHIVNIDQYGKTIRTYRPFNIRDSHLLRLANYFLAEEFNGKANIIYGLYRTDFLRKHLLKVFFGCEFGFDMHFVFDCLQSGEIICDDSVVIYKRQGNDLATSFNESIYYRIMNSLLMCNRLKYLCVYPRITSGMLGRTLLILLVPIKYLKSLLFNIRRFVSGN